MDHDADQRWEAMRTRLLDIAISLDEIEQRRAQLTKVDIGRPPALAYLTGLRGRLAEAEAELEGLRTAMIRRGVIERAKGMLMLRLEVDEGAAFEYLREASMRLNRRVADIAEDVVRTRAGAEVLS